MIDKDKRKAEIFKQIMDCITIYEVSDLISSQEQSMIEKLEEFKCDSCGLFNDVKILNEKVSKLEALKAIDEAINDNCISDAQMMIKNIIKQVSGEQI